MNGAIVIGLQTIQKEQVAVNGLLISDDYGPIGMSGAIGIGLQAIQKESAAV
jgi:hypothetical protein